MSTSTTNRVAISCTLMYRRSTHCAADATTTFTTATSKICHATSGKHRCLSWFAFVLQHVTWAPCLFFASCFLRAMVSSATSTTQSATTGGVCGWLWVCGALAVPVMASCIWICSTIRFSLQLCNMANAVASQHTLTCPQTLNEPDSRFGSRATIGRHKY